MRLLLFHASLFFSLQILAQGNVYNLSNYTTANGLPDNNINCILQDTRRFLWIGTQEGLSRFDGKNFKNYYADKADSFGLPGNIITSIHEYQPGQLVIASSGKLVTFNTVTGVFNQPSQFKKRNFFVIRKLNDHLFSAGFKDSCVLFNEQLQILSVLTPPLNYKNVIVDVVACNDSVWIVGTGKEYFRYYSRTGKYKLWLNGKDWANKDGLLKFQYYDIKNNWLYFSSYQNKLYCFNLDGQLKASRAIGTETIQIPIGNIYFIAPQNDTTFWMGGGEGKSIVLLNRDLTKNEPINNQIKSTVTTSYCKDDKNNEWFGTASGLIKLNYYNRSIKNWTTGFKEINEQNNLIQIGKASDGNMYVPVYSTDYCYKIEFNSNTKKITLLPRNIFSQIWSMQSTGDDLIFTEWGTRITHYNPRTGKYINDDFLKKYFEASDIITLSFTQKNGDKWYSANKGGGLLRIKKINGSIEHYLPNSQKAKFSNSYYSYCTEDKNGNLWFGVNKSDKLLHWNRITNSFSEILFDTIPGITSHVTGGITDIIKDAQDQIWISFDGGGIISYNYIKNTAVNYTKQTGLPTDFVYALQFDEQNRLWIGTIKGLSCLLINEKRFINFTKENGLPADYFNERCMFFDSSNQYMWVGSKNTLLSFKPSELLEISTKQIAVYIDELTVNGNYYRAQKQSEIVFQPFENNFVFHFTSPDINSGNNIEYAYMLMGADKDWINSSTSQLASYNNLSHGTYSFFVRAKHKGDNKWTIIIEPFVFRVATPWYKTTLVRVSFVLLMITTIWLIARNYYRRKLEKQKVQIEKELAIEQERTRMARELHDGLSSMLSGIKHSFTALSNQLQLEEDKKTAFQSNINKLNDSIVEVRNISQSIVPSGLTPNGFENLVRDYCSSFNYPGSINITYNAIDTARMALTEEQAFHLFRIIQELLQNIMKHAEAANAIVQLNYNKGRLSITVEDDGIGFSNEIIETKKGMGLKNIESRVMLLKGKIDFKSKLSEGTSVLIEIPCAENMHDTNL